VTFADNARGCDYHDIDETQIRLRATRARFTGCFSRSRGGEGRIAAPQLVARMRGCARTRSCRNPRVKGEDLSRSENRARIARASSERSSRVQVVRDCDNFGAAGRWNGAWISRGHAKFGGQRPRDLGRKIPGQVYASASFIREKTQAGCASATCIGHFGARFVYVGRR